MHCANCEAAVAGRYCAECGQRVETHIHSLGFFLREATESLTHADSRLWQTAGALLLRPGILTREYLQGRRTSYLPPFRLYLVVSVLFFVTASLLGEGPAISVDADSPGTTTMVTEQDEEAREAVTAAGSGNLAPLCERLTYSVPWQTSVEPRLRASCRLIVGEGGLRLLGREFMANLPSVLILFVPVIAGVMKLMYWRPRRYYVEHLLFFLHNHAFVFVLFTLVLIVGAPLAAGLADLLMLVAVAYCIWYLFRAMRVVYQQSARVTLAKYVLLGITYLVSAVVLTLATLLYSAMSL